MPTLNPNHRQVLAAAPIDGRRTRYSIKGVEGLVLDVTPGGSRSWYVRYQVRNGTSRTFRHYRIGDARSVSLSDATKRARAVTRDVDVGSIDTFAVERMPAHRPVTFGDLFDDWYKRHALRRLALPEDDKRKYEKHLRAPLGERPVETIKRRELAELRDKLATTSGPVLSNHIVALFNRVMNWAVEEGLIEANPGSRLRKIGDVRPRERVLSADHIRRFWQALATMETMTGEHMKRGESGRMLSLATRGILRLLLLTGQRRKEVAQASKAEFDLDCPEPVWTIPGARTKNRLLHRLPLCPLAAREFRKAILASPKESPFVFPSPGDPAKPISVEAVTRAMARMTSEMKMPAVSPHDLRRTVGTEMARLGLPVHVRSLVLNHSPMSRGITDAVYNRYAYDKEKREALMAWEARLAEILLGDQHPQAVSAIEPKLGAVAGS